MTCPTCGTPVIVEGHTTKYYVPNGTLVPTDKLKEMQARIKELESTAEMKPEIPYIDAIDLRFIWKDCAGDHDKMQRRIDRLITEANHTINASQTRCGLLEERLAAAEEALKISNHCMDEVIRYNFEEAEHKYGDAYKAEDWACVRKLNEGRAVVKNYVEKYGDKP